MKMIIWFRFKIFSITFTLWFNVLHILLLSAVIAVVHFLTDTSWVLSTVIVIAAFIVVTCALNCLRRR